MSPEQRLEIEKHLEAVHLILLECDAVRGGDWSFNGWTADDARKVRHQFRLDGYELKGPKVDEERAEREGVHRRQTGLTPNL